MKTKRSVEKSAQGRKAQLKRTLHNTAILLNIPEPPDGETLQHIRDELENALQCFHEYNAYLNVLNTK